MQTPRPLPALLLGLGLIAPIPPLALGADALLLNGGFDQPPAERSAAQPIPQWRFYVWDGGVEAALDPRARPSGGASLRLQGLSPGKAAVHQRVRLQAGRYRLSGLVAARDLRPGKDKLGARLHLELAGRRPVFLNLPQGDADWTRVEAVFDLDLPTDGALYVFLYGTGHVWVDDLALVPLTPGDPARPGSRVADAPTESLRFDPPLSARDLVLAGYCEDPGMPERAVCRRLAGADLSALIPPSHREPLVLARYDPPRPMGQAAGHLDLNPAQGLPGDWTGYDYLEIDLVNPGQTTLEGLIEIRDRQSRNYWSRVNWYTHFVPGEQRIRIPLQVFVGEKSVIRERRRLDTGAVERLFVDLIGPGEVLIHALRLVSEPPYTADFPRLIKLDPGTPVSPVMTGFTPLTQDQSYRPERGYGFDADARFARAEDRRHPDNLLRDWVSIGAGGIALDLPDGDYRVWMMLEDPGYWEYVQNYDRRAVRAEGQLVYEDRMTADDLWARLFAHQDTEDLPGDDIWGRYIPPRYRPVEFPARVADGQLNLTFESGRVGTFANTLSALLIWPAREEERARAFLTQLWERLRGQFEAEYVQTPPTATSVGPEAADSIPGLVAFHRHWGQEVQATDRPGAAERAEALHLSLARGEMEPLTLSLYAGRGRRLTEARLNLPGLQVEPLRVRYKLTRATDDGARYVNAPRLLDPLTLPLDLSAGQSRRLWFSVRAPADAVPGPIDGNLTLTFADGARMTLPVQVRVHPFVLPRANWPYGYLGSAPHYPDSAFPDTVLAKQEADIVPALDLAIRHGMTHFSGGIGGPVPARGEHGLTMDFSRYDAVMEAADGRFPFPPHTYGGLAPGGRLGFQRYRIDDDTQGRYGMPYRQALDRVLAAVRGHGGGRGWREPVYSIGDEPRGADAVAQSAALADAVRAAGARTSVFTSLRGPDSPALPLVDRVDQLFLTHHNAWGLGRILEAGADCGTYNLGSRYARGIYQYRLRTLGCRAGYFQFAFDSTHVDPYYALDGREDDFAAAFPTDSPGRLIPALDLFRFGEAVDDYRYLLALERAMGRPGDASAAAEARAWLDRLMDGLAIDHETLNPGPLDDAALDAIRADAARWIERIGSP